MYTSHRSSSLGTIQTAVTRYYTQLLEHPPSNFLLRTNLFLERCPVIQGVLTATPLLDKEELRAKKGKQKDL